MIMKKIILFSILLSGLTILNSCEKDEGGNIPDLTQVPVVVFTPDASSDAFISPVTPATFKTKFVLELLYPNDVKPQNVDVVVMKNNNTNTVKTIKTGISLPATIEVTGQELITQFGPMSGGDQFDIGVDVTAANGQKVLAFPNTGISYAAGIIQEIGNVKPNSTIGLQYLMPCPYDPNMYQGDFEVVKDDWHDTKPGDVITLTKVDATHFSFKYPTLVNAVPIIVAVNPATNTPSIALQTVGTAWIYDADPPPPTAKTTPSVNNLVNPCDGTVSLNMTWTESTFSGPNLVLSLKKK
jgi:hypothetical protein